MMLGELSQQRADPTELHPLLRSHTAGPPTMVCAHTRLGKGVSFMEQQLDWHYRNLTPELFSQALAEVEGQR